MFGLIIRLVILFAVLFGIAFGLTRLLRSRSEKKAIEKIQQDILALKTGLEEGLYSQGEYESLRDKIEAECKKRGIDVPALPRGKISNPEGMTDA